MPRRPFLAVLLLLMAAALAAFPALADKFYLQLFSTIMIMAIFAMSLNLLVGCAGLISLGHGAFFGLGAYTLLLLSADYNAASFWLSLPAAMAVAGAAAFVIGLLVLRSSGVYFIMVTLAFTQMFFYYVTGAKALGGSDGAYIYVKPDASLFGRTPFVLADNQDFYYLVLALMVATYLLLSVIMGAPFGHVLRGIKANEQRMRSLGYDTFRYKLAAFIIAGALAGLAGYLKAAQFGTVNPDLFGWRQSGDVLMMVILGGMGTLYGPILGAFALVLLENFLAEATRHWLLPMGLFIILAVLALPDGLAGIAKPLAALRRGRPAALGGEPP
jgi:branched-chain amino acid transport system permease protein